MAREWRCKWSEDDDSQSLKDCVAVLDRFQDQLLTLVNDWTSSQMRSKNIMNGRFNVDRNLIQRVVDNEMKDFKIIVKMPVDKYRDWANKDHKPELEILEQLKEIEGVTEVETETYTLEVVNLMSVSLN